MRGARGYAIMYIFMWLLFFSFRHRIKWSWMIILGMGLVYLANFILSYRLGWSVASGFRDVMVSTLNSQGASVEPVFGSVVFREEIRREFGLLGSKQNPQQDKILPKRKIPVSLHHNIFGNRQIIMGINHTDLSH